MDENALRSRESITMPHWHVLWGKQIYEKYLRKLPEDAHGCGLDGIRAAG